MMIMLGTTHYGIFSPALAAAVAPFWTRQDEAGRK
jgi:hypothetical protein